TRRKVAGHVEHVSHAAAHAGGEVASGRAKHDDAAAGHVFATVVAHALDNRAHAGVAHAESFARHAADVSLAARRAVKPDVADDDVFFRHERGTLRRIDNNFSATKSLADVIVRIAFKF